MDSAVAILDIQNGISRLGGNQKLYLKLLAKYYDSLLLGLPPYEWLHSPETKKVFQKEIHTLKGVSGNLAANALFDICKKLDAEMKAGTPKESVYETMLTLHKHTKEAVAKYIEIHTSIHA